MWWGGCGGARAVLLLLLGKRSSGSAGGLVRDRRGRGYVCGYVCVVCVVGVGGCTKEVCRRGCSERENVGSSRSRSGSDVVGSKVRRSGVGVRILGGSSTCCCCCWRCCCCLRRQVKRLNGFRRRFVSEVGSTVKVSASAAETKDFVAGSDKVCCLGFIRMERSCAK